MQELIKVSVNEKGTPFVYAKELFSFLGLDKSQWARWYATNIVNNPFAIENIDWKGFDMVSNGNATKGFNLSIDFAKRLAMMAKTEKGELARLYFLECERRAKSSVPALPTTKELALMVVKAEEEKEELQRQIEANAPKVLFADSVTASGDCVLMRDLAKVITQNGHEIGQNRLFKWMHQHHYLIGNKNEPAQRYVEMGLFKVVKRTISPPNKEPKVHPTTMITGKGQVYFVNKFLNPTVTA